MLARSFGWSHSSSSDFPFEANLISSRAASSTTERNRPLSRSKSGLEVDFPSESTVVRTHLESSEIVSPARCRRSGACRERGCSMEISRVLRASTNFLLSSRSIFEDLAYWEISSWSPANSSTAGSGIRFASCSSPCISISDAWSTLLTNSQVRGVPQETRVRQIAL